MEEVVVLDLFSDHCIPIKVCDVCCILFEQEPTMSGMTGFVLQYVFVSEELDVDIFVGIGVFNPISLIFFFTIPMSESGDVSW